MKSPKIIILVKLFLISLTYPCKSLSHFILYSFHSTPLTPIYTLSLHDALPIFPQPVAAMRANEREVGGERGLEDIVAAGERSEEHTSELQSHSDLVCRLLLEKKKVKK